MIHHSAAYITSEDINSVSQRLSSVMIANGECCENFKFELSSFFNCKNVLLTNSGSSAIYIALKALGSTKREIVLPTYVCKDVLEALIAADLIPVLCDIEDGWNVSYNSIKNKITPNCAAIIVPHNLGICADIREIKKSGVIIIEDCCQCVGGYINSEMAGTIGDISILSFNATKCFTSAEGGAVLINNTELLPKFEKLKNLEHIFRMSDLQAALGLSQLNEYTNFLKKRKEIAGFYFDNLEKHLTATFGKFKEQSMFFRFLLFTDYDFDSFSDFMRSKQVVVRKGIDNLLHKQYCLGKDNDFPNAMKAFNKTISIPIYPTLTSEQMRSVVEAVNSYLK